MDHSTCNNYKSDNNEMAKHEVSIICIGGSGTGKSTLGNFFLCGKKKGHFKTSAGVNSCTSMTDTQSSHGRSFTDTPGIPDTNPANTKDYYNKCINALKGKHSAILFVFKKEKIDPDKFSKSKLLFREMSKANCRKFLLINDHTTYDADDPPEVEDYIKMSDEIKKYTHLYFDFEMVVTLATMCQQMDSIANFFEAVQNGLSPIASPALKNFHELSIWMNNLKTNVDYCNSALKELQDAQKKREAEIVKLQIIRVGTMVAFGALVIIGADGTFGVSLVSIIFSGRGCKALSAPIQSARADVSAVSNDIKNKNACIEKAVEELKMATMEFFELRKAIGDIA